MHCNAANSLQSFVMEYQRSGDSGGIESLLDTYAEACRKALEVEGDGTTDPATFLPASSRSLLGGALISVQRVVYTSAEALAGARSEATAKGCRLVCRTMQGGTDCFWVCPPT